MNMTSFKKKGGNSEDERTSPSAIRKWSATNTPEQHASADSIHIETRQRLQSNRSRSNSVAVVSENHQRDMQSLKSLDFEPKVRPMRSRSSLLSTSTDALPYVRKSQSHLNSFETPESPPPSLSDMHSSDLSSPLSSSISMSSLIDDESQRDPYYQSLMAMESASEHFQGTDGRIHSNQVKEAIYQVHIRFHFDIQPKFIFENMLTNMSDLTACSFGFVSSVKRKNNIRTSVKETNVTVRNLIRKNVTPEVKMRLEKLVVDGASLDELWVSPIKTSKIIALRSVNSQAFHFLPHVPSEIVNLVSIPILDSKKEVSALFTSFNRSPNLSKEDLIAMQPFLKTCANLLEALSYKKRANSSLRMGVEKTGVINKRESVREELNISRAKSGPVSISESRAEARKSIKVIPPKIDAVEMEEEDKRKSISSPPKLAASPVLPTSPTPLKHSSPSVKQPASPWKDIQQKFGIKKKDGAHNFVEMMLQCIDSGDHRASRKLLRMKKFADQSNTPIGEKTILHHAVGQSDHETVEILSEHAVQVNTRDQTGRTPLHVAIPQNNTRIIQALSSSPNIDTNLIDGVGVTPFHLLCEYYPSPSSLRKIFDGFLARKTDINKQDSVTGETPSHKALMNQHVRGLLVRLLLDYNCEVNRPDFSGKTPLHASVMVNRVDLTMDLSSANASTTAVDNKQQTALDVAIVNDCSTDVVMLSSRTRELESWMEKLGMSESTPLFLKERIFKDTLPMVDEKMLHDLGITKMGSRSRSLTAIQESKESKGIPGEVRSMAIPIVGKIPAAQSRPAPESPRQRPQRSRRGSIAPTPLSPPNFDTDKSLDSSSPPSQPLSYPSPMQMNGDIFGTFKLRFEEMGIMKDPWIEYSTLEFTKQLSSGASGQVYKGLHKSREVAIKVVDKRPQDITDFKYEFETLRSLRHPNIVNSFGACLEPQLCLVMEYCSRGSLYDLLCTSLVFDVAKMLDFAIQMTKGVRCSHSSTPQVLHRDSKTMNFLVSDDWMVKVCDLGSARPQQTTGMSTSKKSRGTATHISPEICNGLEFTVKSDVYSLGICSWEMVYRCFNGKYQTPFAEYKMESSQIVLQTGQGSRPTMPKAVPSMMSQSIRECWSADPQRRPDCETILERSEECKAKAEEEPHVWDIPPPDE